MNYHPFSSSGVLPTARITIPAPISTGVSLSERFRHLATPQVTHGVGGHGGSHFGLGMPQNIPASVNYASRQVDNRAFAIALAKRAQIQALQLKRKSHEPLRGSGGRGRTRTSNLPVTARLGTVRVKNQQVINPRSGIRVIRGARGARGGGRGGLSFIQRIGGTGGKKVVATARLGTRGAIKGRGGRFQRGSQTSTIKSGRGGAGGKWKGEIKSKEDLDNELDSYMSKSKTFVRSNLDKELDAYMLEARAQAEAVAAAVSTPAVGSDNDVVMSEA